MRQPHSVQERVSTGPDLIYCDFSLKCWLYFSMSYQAMTNNIIILAVMKTKFIWVTQFNEVESLDSICSN